MATIHTPAPLLDKVLEAIDRSSYVKPHFLELGIKSATTLLAYRSSFFVAPSETDLDEMHDELAAQNGKPGRGKWPTDPVKGKRALRAFIMHARGLLASESSAPTTALGATGASVALTAASAAASATALAPGTAAASARDISIGKTAYETASKIYKKDVLSLDAHERISYEQVGKLHHALTTAMPLSIPLSEYKLHLKLSTGSATTYEAFGKTWTSTEAFDKPATITTPDDLKRAMAYRRQAEAVAGAFDVDANAALQKQPPPPASHRLASSKTSYIDGGSIVSKDLYVTMAGLLTEERAMTTFRDRNPHAPIAKIVARIDGPVQQRKAALLLEGYTLDAAIHLACEKSPELYSASLLDGDASAHDPDDKTAVDQRTGKAKRASERTADEATAAKDRRIEQMNREITNLKNKRTKNGPPTGGGGGGGGGAAGTAAHVPGGRAPGPDCPDGYCKDFNFKAGGCPRGSSCHRVHKCAQCHSTAHGFRGNH